MIYLANQMDSGKGHLQTRQDSNQNQLRRGSMVTFWRHTGNNVQSGEFLAFTVLFENLRTTGEKSTTERFVHQPF